MAKGKKTKEEYLDLSKAKNKKTKKLSDNEYIAEIRRKRIINAIIILGAFLLLLGLFLLFLKIMSLVINIQNEPESLNATIQTLPQLRNSSSSVKQFYPNMKFNHNNISYKIGEDCLNEKKSRVVSAFDQISSEVGVISFHSTAEAPDIQVLCSKDERYEPLEKTDFFIAGEGGAREIVQTMRYNVINNGIIFLYDNAHNSPECNWPNIEIHELMHVLGFNHSADSKSLMYPYLESCSQKLDSSIITELKRLYSENNLPDLYFENLSAVKKGRYLDFNLTIRNSGDVDAENVSFSILDDGELVETKEVNNLRFGAGIVMEINNFKLLNIDSDKIDIIIDYKNTIKEIDKSNNIATIRF